MKNGKYELGDVVVVKSARLSPEVIGQVLLVRQVSFQHVWLEGVEKPWTNDTSLPALKSYHEKADIKIKLPSGV